MSLLEDMAVYFRIGRTDLLRIIRTAPARYKQYTIPKRAGGVRTIAQPSRELKALQRYIMETKLSLFPIHNAATGYIKKRNILYNAECHQHARVILKLDFENFFPSITVRDWDFLLSQRRPIEIERGDLQLYRQILFWGQESSIPRCLSIGAPTSPMLSNIILFRLDTRLSGAAASTKVSYTRYADDITVSGESIEDVRKFEGWLIRTLHSMKSPTLTLNHQKRGMYLKGQKRMVAGLKITPMGSVSIGRERKRLTSVMLHKVLLGETGVDHLNYVKGMLGFCLANEPEFVLRLRIKYGNDVVDRVLQFRSPPRPRRAV
jgi:RNA-directed DNA polymerase